MASRIVLLSWQLTLVLIIWFVKGISGLDLSLGFIQEPSDVITERNRPLIINCSAYSLKEYGPAQVSWRHKGVEINDSRREVLSNGSLLFHKVIHQKKSSESDAGEYQCVATNTVGSLVRPITITIANFSRKSVKESRTQVVEEGDVVRFLCQIAAVPPPVFTWQKNKENIPQNSDRFITLKNSGTLLIKNALVSDTGNYRCVVAPSMGNHRRTSEIHLTVKPALKQFVSPRFISPKITVSVKVGEEATLECAATGYPKPTVSWNTYSMVNTSRIYKKEPGLLVFSKTLPGDTGVYTCNVSNYHPVTKELYSLVQSIKLDVLVPPTFIKRPQSFIVPSVQTVRFECEAQGYPTPKIQWLKNGEPINSHNSRMKIKNFALVIPQTVTNDSGLYQCIAQNTVGLVSADARLKINMSRDQPDPPTGLTARTLSSTSINLLWNASTSRNGLAIQAYTVHYAPTTGGDELSKVAVSPSCTIDMLKPYTNYTFYVRAYNGRSASDQSETIVLTTGEDLPAAAPTVALTSSSPTTLHVYWDEMPSELARGVIIMYKIQWRRRNLPSHYIQEVSGDLHEYTITGLQAGGKYEVRVMGATKFGYPILTDDMWPWVQQTMPVQGTVQVPSSPSLELTVVNATTIKIQWEILESNEYAVAGFKLAYRKQNSKLRDPLIIPNNSTNYYLLSDLLPHTWYEVHLTAYNENGDGRESVRQIQTYSESDPQSGGKYYNPQLTYVVVESPSHLEAEPTNSTCILLSWKEPVTLKNISYFTVRFNPVRDGHVNASSVTYINSTNRAVLVTGLSPYTLYEFSVRSQNSDDVEGPYSSKVECKTKEDVPSEPTEVNWSPLDTQSIKLTWKPPKFPNGVIVNYYVIYDLNKDNACQVNKGMTQEANGSEFASILKGLMSNTQYYLCVRARTRAGIGSATEMVTLNIQTSNLRNHSSVQSSTSEEHQDPQLGIILGFTIGITCMIVCAIVVIFRNRCHFMDPLAHHYVQHGNKRANCNGHISTDATREMESFMPMLTQINTSAPHLDTKGGYPMMCCNGKKNGYSHAVIHDKQKSRSKKNKPSMNITENPQHTMWFLTIDSIEELQPSPLMERQPMDDDSDESRNEDSGVQLAPSQDTGSLDQESRTSSRDAEFAERNSAAAVPTTYVISPISGSNIQRSQSWDSCLQKHINSWSSSQSAL